MPIVMNMSQSSLKINTYIQFISGIFSTNDQSDKISRDPIAFCFEAWGRDVGKHFPGASRSVAMSC
ncbi:hypothetical protein PSZ24_23295, partial [Shigella flexneri]|nr:hypothetical protein [Shigella flexneri]